MAKAVRRLLKQLRPISATFDAIAFTGLSGSLIVPTVAMRLKKNVVAVRKEKTPHSLNVFEGRKSQNFIIIDDCVAGGTTVRRIRDSVPTGSKLVGVALYCDYAGYTLKNFCQEHGAWYMTQSDVAPKYYP